MIRRSDYDIRVGSDRFTRHAKVFRRASHQSDIRFEVTQRCNNTMAITHINSDIDLWVFFHEGSDQPQSKVFRGRHQSDAHAPAEMSVSAVKRAQKLRHHVVDT